MYRDAPPIPRLGPLDALILVASIALGVWLSAASPKRVEAGLGLIDTETQFQIQREQVREMRRQRDLENPPRHTWRDWIVPWRGRFLDLTSYILPIAAIGAGVATFRHRGARSRRSLRKVGVLTTAVAGSFAAVAMTNEWILRRFTTLQVGYSHNPFSTLWDALSTDMSLGIAALWAVLIVGRRWRTDPSWADRIGRILGVGWIAVAILGILLAEIFFR